MGLPVNGLTNEFQSETAFDSGSPVHDRLEINQAVCAFGGQWHTERTDTVFEQSIGRPRKSEEGSCVRQKSSDEPETRLAAEDKAVPYKRLEGVRPDPTDNITGKNDPRLLASPQHQMSYSQELMPSVEMEQYLRSEE